MSTLVHRLQLIPTPIAGLALGISSLGWSLESFFALNGYGQKTGAVIGSLLILLLAAKYALNPGMLREDLAHPVIGSIVPTFAMTTMVISVSVREWVSMDLGVTLWLFGILSHLIFLMIFAINRAKQIELHYMVPSWFVPPVGIIVADVSFPGIPLLHPLAIGVLYLGIGLYAVMLPAMIYRFIFSREIPDAAKPTIAIMAAPASLSLAGYLSVVVHPSALVVALLAGIAVLMTAITYMVFTRLMRLPFSPGYAAFTFPMVIGATALSKTVHWMQAYGCSEHDIAIVHALATFEVVVATLIVGYVALHYLSYFVSAIMGKHAFYFVGFGKH